ATGAAVRRADPGARSLHAAALASWHDRRDAAQEGRTEDREAGGRDGLRRRTQPPYPTRHAGGRSVPGAAPGAVSAVRPLEAGLGKSAGEAAPASEQRHQALRHAGGPPADGQDEPWQRSARSLTGDQPHRRPAGTMAGNEREPADHGGAGG